MGNFIKEFKEFALKGNVMDMAVGVIIGGAFTAIVTAFTDDFITPILGLVGGAECGGTLPLGNSGQALLWGHFVSSVVNFLIMAFILFCIVKAMNALVNLGKKKEEEKPAEDPDDIKLLKEMLAVMKEQAPEAAKRAEEKVKKE